MTNAPVPSQITAARLANHLRVMSADRLLTVNTMRERAIRFQHEAQRLSEDIRRLAHGPDAASILATPGVATHVARMQADAWYFYTRARGLVNDARVAETGPLAKVKDNGP